MSNLINPCACIGSSQGEPYCPCVMKQKGLTSLPRVVNEVKLTTVLGEIFNWSKESNQPCQKTEKLQKNLF